VSKENKFDQNYIPTIEEQDEIKKKLPMWIDYKKLMERRFIISKLIHEAQLKIKNIIQ